MSNLYSSIAKQYFNFDEVDKVPTKYYGFIEEELDFIINYDIKYRQNDRPFGGVQMVMFGDLYQLIP